MPLGALGMSPCPASAVLETLQRESPGDEVTVRWVVDRLDRQSFGVVLLLLGIVAVVPGICTLAGLLIAMLGIELILGRNEPYFPHWIAHRRVGTRHVRPVVTSAIAVLRLIERFIHPRWFAQGKKLSRLLGLVVLLASIRLILVPFPFSNILPALVVALVSLAYLEKDGALLLISLAVAAGNLALDSALVAGIFRQAGYSGSFWW